MAGRGAATDALPDGKPTALGKSRKTVMQTREPRYKCGIRGTRIVLILSRQ
jgi:hypothetical protein